MFRFGKKDDDQGRNKGFDPDNQPDLGQEEQEEERFDPRQAYSSLEQRFTQEFDAARRREERFLSALERLGQQPRTEEKVQKAEVTFDDLPDPVAEPEKFKTALKDKFRQSAEAGKQEQEARSRTEQDREREQRRITAELDDVWTSFEGDYPELAKRTRVVKGIVLDLIEQGEKRGLTREQVILSDPEAFKAKIVSIASEELGISPEDFGGKPQKARGRTMGIPGGQPRSSGSGKGETRTTFMDELKDVQGKMGLYHVN